MGISASLLAHTIPCYGRVRIWANASVTPIGSGPYLALTIRIALTLNLVLPQSLTLTLTLSPHPNPDPTKLHGYIMTIVKASIPKCAALKSIWTLLYTQATCCTRRRHTVHAGDMLYTQATCCTPGRHARPHVVAESRLRHHDLLAKLWPPVEESQDGYRGDARSLPGPMCPRMPTCPL